MKCIISAKNESLRFSTNGVSLAKITFRKFLGIYGIDNQFRAIIPTTCKVCVDTFLHTRGIQYSPFVSLSVTGSQSWHSGRNTCILLNTKNDILDVPKHGNKRDLIHFVTPHLILLFVIQYSTFSIFIGNIRFRVCINGSAATTSETPDTSSSAGGHSYTESLEVLCGRRNFSIRGNLEASYGPVSESHIVSKNWCYTDIYFSLFSTRERLLGYPGTRHQNASPREFDRTYQGSDLRYWSWKLFKKARCHFKS